MGVAGTSTLLPAVGMGVVGTSALSPAIFVVGSCVGEYVRDSEGEEESQSVNSASAEIGPVDEFIM